MSSKGLILVLVVTSISFLPVASLFCPRKCSIHDILACRPIPKHEECFPTQPFCSCCKTCSGQMGSICNYKSPRCRPNMVCQHINGIQSKVIYRWVPWFTGRCQVMVD
ncbi:hypothetical protein LOTGIDRAFT_174065 [Lottia gigantea]|uniref:IGFBP N-terminal domain-containing protein n=1 Tax=Lottia gigantea TaxID=225164 RepID=V4AYG9_LOTGI|nr:hypothetical protein LOTGIDRAFT_174065 [Lottia gigantea]ESO98696.1 hypothetical protein LOTGIDRAFT_174065 [Lottia gigantea]